MTPLLAIARFELRKRARMISTYVYVLVYFAIGALWAALAGGAFPGGSVSFGAGGKVFANSPYSLEILVSLSGHFGLLVTAAVAARATYQDVEADTTAFFFTAPISKRAYLGGRFLGAIAFLMLVYSSIAAGAWCMFRTGICDAGQLGPERGIAYVQPYLVILLPNVFFLGAVFFSLAALTRKMTAVYVGAVVCFVGYLVGLNVAGSIENRWIGSLVDPFGIVATDTVTRYWSVAERNAKLVPLAGALLANRAAWTAAGAALLAFTFARFRSERAGAPRPIERVTEPVVTRAIEIPRATPSFGSRHGLAVLASQTRLEIAESVKNVYFGVILLTGVLFLVVTGFQSASAYESKTYPVTTEVVTWTGGLFSIFVIILITFLSGEIVHRERDAKMAQIYDALPVPTPIVALSKLLALLAIPIFLVATVWVTSLGIQTARGFHHYELGVYLRYLVGVQLVRYWIFALLAFFVHVVVNNKYVGHLALVVYTLLTLSIRSFGLEHHLFLYGSIPRIELSAMNGFGHFALPAAHYLGAWAAMGVALAILATALWVRGLDAAPRLRLALARARLGRASVAGLVASLGAFGALAAMILVSTTRTNRYRTEAASERAQAEYETHYKAREADPQPRIVKVTTRVDIFPSERRARLAGRYVLRNFTSARIDDVHLALLEDAKITALEFAGGSSSALEDRAHGFLTRKLARPLGPGEETTLDFDLAYEHPAFVDHDPDSRFAENGTFFDSGYFPRIGYQSGGELVEDAKRRKHGLAPKRALDLDDPKGRERNYLAHDADWIDVDATVSTSLDQIAISPGALERTWTEGDRRFCHYAIKSKILCFFSFLSARWATKTDRWNDVAIEIDYHPDHAFDVDRMIASVKASLGYFTESFGPYQHELVRIVEFPRYETFAQSFPNTIPYSEAIGFITQVDDKPDAIDMPTYVTAHEVAHQWWGHQLISGELQGSTVLSETLAQYSALMVMKRKLGPLAMKRFLRLELDRYLAGRGQEARRELPLVRVEDQGYIHYAKGSLAMFALADALGEDRVNAALRRLVEAWRFRGPPYPTSRALVDELRKETNGENAHLIEDLFETITLFENHAERSTKKKRDAGGYEVHVVGTAKKLRADEQGNETKIASDDAVDVGVLDKDGNVIHLERARPKDDRVDVTMIVTEGEPAKAGVDPRNVLVDRLPDDNVVNVETE